jgi:hypothetical protein
MSRGARRGDGDPAQTGSRRPGRRPNARRALLALATPALLAGCAGVAPIDRAAGAATAADPGRGARIVREETFDFQAGAWGGDPPAEFVAVESGEAGAPGKWYLDSSDEGPGEKVIAQQRWAAASPGQFPMLVYERLSARDADVCVRFEPVSGLLDQAGGIAFRFQDASNYYVARANALEDDVRLFKVVAGERIQIAAKDAEVARGRWHLLKVSARGPHIEVALDGARVIDVEDSTFDAPGKIGLWTKADSVTRFDSLKIETYDGP